MKLREQLHAAARASLPVCGYLVQMAPLPLHRMGLNVLVACGKAGHVEKGALPP